MQKCRMQIIYSHCLQYMSEKNEALTYRVCIVGLDCTFLVANIKQIMKTRFTQLVCTRFRITILISITYCNIYNSFLMYSNCVCMLPFGFELQHYQGLVQNYFNLLLNSVCFDKGILMPLLK